MENGKNLRPKPSFPKLLEPGRIGEMALKNRIKFASTTTNFCTEEGQVTARERAFLAERSRGGAALVTTEGAPVTPKGGIFSHSMRVWDDRFVPELRELAMAIQEQGAKACLQLLEGGRYSHSEDGAVAPTAMPPAIPRLHRPRELATEEVLGLVEAHAQAARRGKEAGFDCTEICGIAGYLVASFLSPRSNKRTDRYGGSLRNRARFLIEIIEAVKGAVSAGYPVIVRLCGDELVEEGNTPEDMRIIARMAEEAGMDALSLAVGWHESKRSSISMEVPAGHWLYLAEAMKQMVKVPVMMAYRLNDPYLAEKAMEEGKIDFWEMCRPLLADPEIPIKLTQNRPEDIAPCVACNQGCFARMWYRQPITCLVNPRVGREGEDAYRIEPAPTSKKVLVVGGGPAGMEAARVMAKRGHEVTLWEKEDHLGGLLNLAAGTPTRDEMGRIVPYLSGQLQKLGVRVELGREATPAQVEAERPQAVVIATGSRPFLPVLEGVDGPGMLTADQVINGASLMGPNVVVWGGSQQGIQVAELLASQGKRVTIVEEKEKVGKDIVTTERLGFLRRLSQLGVEVLTQCSVVRGGAEGITLLDNGEERVLQAANLVVAVGRSSNQGLWGALQGRIEELYIIGDALAPRKSLNAIWDGFRTGLQV